MKYITDLKPAIKLEGIELGLLNNQVELFTGKNAIVYCAWNLEEVIYFVVDEDGKETKYKSVHPQHLNEDQRHEVLGYTLSQYHEDEIVNYNDMFIHFGYLKQVKSFTK